MKRAIPWLLATTVAALLLYWIRPTPACGPFYFPPVFTEIHHPDFPALNYTLGQLGVIQPTYNRLYLYVAYRNLIGPGFSPEEARALWDGRTDILGQSTSEASPAEEQQNPSDLAGQWISARDQILKTKQANYPWTGWTQEGVYREENLPDGRVLFYPNCLPQAYHTALNTLQDRTNKYGAGGPDLAEWLKGQDAVFSNCQKGRTIPAPLRPDAAPLQRADRQYQIAAAYFYSGDFPQAEAAFREIATDPTSPWRSIANYLVARACIRQATVGHDYNSPDPAALNSAEEQLTLVLADTRSAELHRTAASLLGYVEARLHPNQRIHEIAQALLLKPAPADLDRKAKDYTYLLDKLENEQFLAEPGQLQAGRLMVYPKLADLRAHDDLTDWIMTFQLDDPSALDHAYEKWRQTHAAAWLVACLTKVQHADARAPELIEAAESVTPAAPAYTSLTFHRFRLMMQSGRRAEVLPELERLLARDAQSLSRSSQNLFLAMRMSYALDLKDFLKYAQRVPVEITYAYGPIRPRPPTSTAWFDSDALVVLNQQMPLSILAEAAENPDLPERLRRQIALGAWTRAVLLGDDHDSVALAPVLAALAPELRTDLDAFAGAPTPEARRFAGIFLILRFPGLRPYITSPERSMPIEEIDDLRENWWGVGMPCGLPWSEWYVSASSGINQLVIQGPVLEAPINEIYPKGEVPPASFLSRAQLDQARTEWNKTRSLAVASIVLGEQTIHWVGAHPDDPRAAEALARVVRAGHLGCDDKDRWKVSKQAFEMLHERYPASKWAKQTKYWYR